MNKEPVAPYLVLTTRYDCKFCHGEGVIRQRHPYGSTTATETLDCECAFEGCFTELMSMIDCGQIGYSIEAHPAWIEETERWYAEESMADDAMKGSL